MSLSVSKDSWEKLQRELSDSLRKLREFSNRDPERQRLIEELASRQQFALYEEDLSNLPEWVENLRSNELEHKRLAPARMKAIEAVKKSADDATGREFGDSLWVRADIKLTRFSIYVWYETDAELEAARKNGRQEDLRLALEKVSDQIANAPAEVTFHSRQFVREKCGGNLRRYLG